MCYKVLRVLLGAVTVKSETVTGVVYTVTNIWIASSSDYIA